MSADNVTPIRRDPRAPESRFPATASEKVVTAKTIVQAVLAVQDSEAPPENYDMHWPLSMAIELLSEALEAIERMESSSG